MCCRLLDACVVCSHCFVVFFVPWQLARTLLPDTNNNIIVFDSITSALHGACLP